MQPLLAVKSPHAHRGQIFTDAKDPGCAQLAASKLQWSFAWLNTSTGHSSLSIPVCLRYTHHPQPPSPSTILSSTSRLRPSINHCTLSVPTSSRIPQSRREGAGADTSPLGSRSAPICICDWRAVVRGPDARHLLLHRQAKTLMPKLVSSPNYSLSLACTLTQTNICRQAHTHASTIDKVRWRESKRERTRKDRQQERAGGRKEGEGGGK